MFADLGLVIAAIFEQLPKLRFARPVIFENRRGRNRRRGPFGVEPVGYRLHYLQVAAMVAEEHDVPETVQFETTGGEFEGFFERRFRRGDRAGELHMRSRRVETAF